MIAHDSKHRPAVEEYARRVVDGEVVAGQLAVASCQRFIRDLEIGLERGLWFDWAEADRVIEFFGTLKHSTSIYAGTFFDPAPFQKFILANLFGWRRTDNLRRFREGYISVARGNGKSPLGAGILTYESSFDRLMTPSGDYRNEIRAENYSVATKRDQARIVFNEAARFVEQNEHLKSIFRIRNSRLHNRVTWSTIEPLGSDSNVTDGLIIQCIVRDEVHAWQPKHRGLHEKIETALGKRPQPLAITITTAGDEDSVLWQEQYEISKDVVTGVYEADSHFSFIAEIDEDDDPLDEKNWPKANPLLEAGVVKIDHLRDLAKKTRGSQALINEFTRYHCNRQVTSENRLISAKLWANGSRDIPDDLDLSQCSCFGGFDWGWQDDLAAFGWVFLVGEETIEDELRPIYAVKTDCFIPRNTKRSLTKEPWCNWIASGLLTVTEMETTDPYAIYQRLEERNEQWLIQKLVYDRNNCSAFGTKAGFELGITTENFAQTTANYHGPMMELLAALKEGRILHGGNELLGWAAQNMVARESPDGRYIMPGKGRSRDKIDPIVAVIMAIGEAMLFENVFGSDIQLSL